MHLMELLGGIIKMTRYGLICLLLGAMAWGQAASPTSTPAPQNPSQPAAGAPATAAPGGNPAGMSNQPDTSKVAPDAPVITINGLCDNPPADKTAASDCKTVVNRDEFEKLVNAIQPMMPPRARRQFAMRYADALVRAQKAQQMGLDQGPQFDLHMKLMRIQVLAQALNQAMQEKASQISDKDIEDFYNANLVDYEEVDLQRVFVPLTQQLATPKTKLSAAEEQKRSKAADATMKSEANKLHTRAVAGEPFKKLQAEAFLVAGIKTKSPTTSMEKTRRNSLPPSQVSVMDLKTGEVSAVLTDQSGYFIYKAGPKQTLPLDEAKEEIRGAMRTKRLQEGMQSIQQSATPTLSDSYFGPEGPGGMMPRPGAAPSPQPTPPGPK
jgi:hypothetical protein